MKRNLLFYGTTDYGDELSNSDKNKFRELREGFENIFVLICTLFILFGIWYLVELLLCFLAPSELYKCRCRSVCLSVGRSSFTISGAESGQGHLWDLLETWGFGYGKKLVKSYSCSKKLEFGRC